jgi:hypothetical protein
VWENCWLDLDCGKITSGAAALAETERSDALVCSQGQGLVKQDNLIPFKAPVFAGLVGSILTVGELYLVPLASQEPQYHSAQ